MEDRTGKVLRTVGILFFGFTTAFNLLGGIGTTCAAFLTLQYPSMEALLDFQWLYQALVITTTLLGIAGIWVTVELIRKKERAYRNAVVLLVIGTIIGGIHMFASISIRGKATPADMKFYINTITLILFLIFSIPGIRQKVNFSKNGGGTDTITAGGLALILVGVILLTTPLWAGPSHTFQGDNWVLLLETPLYITGILFTGGGIALLMRVIVDVIRQEFALVDLKSSKDF